jgi:hypothetical protein
MLISDMGAVVFRVPCLHVAAPGASSRRCIRKLLQGKCATPRGGWSRDKHGQPVPGAAQIVEARGEVSGEMILHTNTMACSSQVLPGLLPQSKTQMQLHLLRHVVVRKSAVQ